MGWVKQCGRHFAVPVWLVRALVRGWVEDVSVAGAPPTFAVRAPSGAVLRIVVEHPVEARRETWPRRFTLLNADGGLLVATNAERTARGVMLAWRRGKERW